MHRGVKYRGNPDTHYRTYCAIQRTGGGERAAGDEMVGGVLLAGRRGLLDMQGGRSSEVTVWQN